MIILKTYYYIICFFLEIAIVLADYLDNSPEATMCSWGCAVQCSVQHAAAYGKTFLLEMSHSPATQARPRAGEEVRASKLPAGPDAPCKNREWT